MRILKLTLKKQWFDLIASGEKKEEYRTPGPWIESRVNPQKNYDAVEFTNGYSKGRAVILVEYNGATRGCGRSKWGAVPGVEYLILFRKSVV